VNDQLVLALCFSTLGIALIILAVLITKRGGYTAPDGSQIEAMRQQNSNEHGAHEAMTRDIKGKVDNIHRRFGFLDDPMKPEPPIPPGAKPSKEDTQ
jgi:hypothetical protein